MKEPGESEGKWAEMERRYLRITFEGAAVLDHEADVETFAPALLSAAHLLQRVTKIRHGSNFTVKLKLAGVEGNCISFDIAVVQTILEKFVNFLSNMPLLDTLTVVGFVQSTSGYTLIDLYKFLKGRLIISEKDEGKNVLIETADGEKTSVPKPVLELYKDRDVKKTLRGTTRPLDTKGIDRMKFSDPECKSVIEIEKDESPWFDVTPIENEIEDEEIVVFGRLDRPSLQGEQGGWKLIRGGDSFSMTVTDEDFLEAVRKNDISFSSSTIYRVELLISQSISADGKLRYKNVAKTIRRVRTPEQTTLAFEEDEPGE